MCRTRRVTPACLRSAVFLSPQRPSDTNQTRLSCSSLSVPRRLMYGDITRASNSSSGSSGFVTHGSDGPQCAVAGTFPAVHLQVTLLQSAKFSPPPLHAITTSSLSHLSGVICHPTQGSQQVSNHTQVRPSNVFFMQKKIYFFCTQTKLISVLLFSDINYIFPRVDQSIVPIIMV